MNRPRIFVATMASGEGDFQESMKAVQVQKDIELNHFVIAGFGELEAHNAVWAAWRERRAEHDLFVKVDADTVLVRDTILAEIWAEFQKNKRVTGLQAPLADYMTDDLINGLNACDTRVTFNDSKDDLFCDRHVDTNHDVVLRDGSGLPTSLIPAGRHCHLANDEQAFHYGLHRMLKGQRWVINKVYQAFTRDHDRVRGMALVGAQFHGRFTKERKFNYNDDAFQAAFEEARTRYDELAEHLKQGRLDRIQ